LQHETDQLNQLVSKQHKPLSFNKWLALIDQLKSEIERLNQTIDNLRKPLSFKQWLKKRLFKE